MSLPKKLPAPLPLLWEKELNHPVHAGIAVNSKHCLIADRGPLNQFDLFSSLDPQTGETKWEVLNPAVGDLDYGNSSRSTPVLGKKLAWFQGAFGDLHCVDLESGNVRWQENVIAAYGPGRQLIWGLCSSPIVRDSRVIINPGGEQSSLVSLNANTGKLAWQTPGNDFGYGSFITAAVNGTVQIIGHDKTTLGGWDFETGKRIWSVTPEESDDFNVPTPIFYQGKLIVATENNGTRIYEFASTGKLIPKPLATQTDLSPETISPVVAGKRLYGICGGTLYCLELPSLKLCWEKSEPAFDSHACLITDNKRLLIASDGELFLINAEAARYEKISQEVVFLPGTVINSHPAIVGSTLYIRGGSQLKCLSLKERK